MKPLIRVDTQSDPNILWLAEHLTEGGQSVSSFVPDLYPECVRVLNPLIRNNDEVKWRDISNSVGMKPSGDMDGEQLSNLASSRSGIDYNIEIGTVNLTVAENLSRILSEYTSTPESCYFGIWPGYGNLAYTLSPVATYILPPDRETVFFQGPVGSAVECVDDSASGRRCIRWMPADHNWCVGNDIYGDSVYVSGSQECIDSIMSCDALETYRVGFSSLLPRI